MSSSSKFNSNFDLLIIGAGVQGCALAWEAQSRGLKVALIEKNDFGSGTSAGCFKIVHGGLRYLQHFDFLRVIQSAREQRNLRRIAPHLVQPLKFLLPCFGYGKRGKEYLGLGLFLYDLLTIWRNIGIGPRHKLLHAEFVTKTEVMSLAPGLKISGLRGGIVYNDCIMLNSDRLTLSFLQSAQKAGAVVANYVEATGCNCNEHHSQKKIESVTCLDKISGEQFEIKAKIVINATGPWARNVADKLLTIDSKRTTTNVFSKGIQVVLPPLNNETKLKHESAILVDSFHVDPAAKISRGVRSYFFVPWQGVTLAGTYDRVFKGDPDNFKITEEEVASFLEEIGQNYTAEELKLENVRYVFGGLRPIAKNYTLGSADAVGDNSVQVSNKDEIIDHLEPNDANWPKVDNLFSVIGVKYTTCRLLAEKVVDLISTKRSLEVNKSSTSRTVLIGGESTDVKKLVRKFSEIITEISPKLFLSLEDDYGSEIEKILELISEDKTLVQELVPGSKVIKAQVVHAARNEFAKNLSDVVFRRTSLATKGYPGEQALTSAAEILAKEFNWTSQKIKEEVQSVTNSHYFKLSH